MKKRAVWIIIAAAGILLAVLAALSVRVEEGSVVFRFPGRREQRISPTPSEHVSPSANLDSTPTPSTVPEPSETGTPVPSGSGHVQAPSVTPTQVSGPTDEPVFTPTPGRTPTQTVTPTQTTPPTPGQKATPTSVPVNSPTSTPVSTPTATPTPADPYENEKKSSVRAYGAAGDGKTDDSSAFLACIADGNVVIEVPKGTYDLKGKSITLPADVIIKGEGSNLSVLKNVNINAPYGITLTGLTLDGGTDRMVPVATGGAINGNIIINAMPVGAQCISYNSCVFKNCDYASLAKHHVSGSPNRLISDSITDCVFENIKRAAVYHCLDIKMGTYTGNTFSNIGSVYILKGELGALKIGDTTTNSDCSVKYAVISGNSFSNLMSGDDPDRIKHDIAVNFITVKGVTANIENNTFSDLTGYGEDREAVYTKVRYLKISNNTITNGGLGEGYICNKSEQYADAYAVITDNIIKGAGGVGVRNYGAGRIEGNTIDITNARGAVSCFCRSEDKNTSLAIRGNNITLKAGLPLVNGKPVESDYSRYVIHTDSVRCPVYIENNTITALDGDIRFESAIRIGHIICQGYIRNNRISCETGAGCGIQITGTSEEHEYNRKITVEISGNDIFSRGACIQVLMSYTSDQTSQRTIKLIKNELKSSTEQNYGGVVSLGTGNGDTVYFEKGSRETAYLSNVLYTNAAKVSGDAESLKAVDHMP
jgi:hypothetical protein